MTRSRGLHRRALLASAASLVALPFAGVENLSAAPTGAGGGTLTYAVFPEPTSLVAISTSGGGDRLVSAKVVEGLFTYDFDLKPKPQLALSWSATPDGLEYTFNLRPNVKWHDGRPFTSADVAFSLLLVKEIHPRGRATFANVRAVRTPDPLTAVVVLSAPAPYLVYALAAGETPIVPKHVYETGDPRTNPANQAPIGTGPFVFKSWAKGSHAVYERNRDYWDAGKPHVDRLVVRFIPDAGARAAALESGEVDISGGNPVALSDLDRLKALPNLAITTEGNNYQPQQVQLEFNVANRYFKDQRVRQAVAHALDRKVIVDTIYFGYAIPAPSPISPLDARFYDPTVETHPLDPAKAEALLDAAGLPRGANGNRFAVTLDYNPFAPERLQLAYYIKQALAKIGIDVTIRTQDFPTFVKRVYTDRDFDFEINGLSNIVDPTVGVQRAYWSKNIIKGVPFSNGSGYSNPEVDRLLEAAAIEPSHEKRVQLFNAFQQIVAREVPLINLVTKLAATVYNERVSDHTVTGDGLEGNFSDVRVAAK